MSLLLESITLGLVIGFMILGLVGVVVPLIPGTLLIWLSILIHAVANSFEAVTPLSFAIITVIALVTGTADFWMTLLGAKTGGASGRSILLGVLGAIIGSFILPLFGTIIGYALGVLWGEYQKHDDWDAAFKASVGGLAGWGLATVVQLAGGLLMLFIFLGQVL